MLIHFVQKLTAIKEVQLIAVKSQIFFLSGQTSIKSETKIKSCREKKIKEFGHNNRRLQRITLLDKDKTSSFFLWPMRITWFALCLGFYNLYSSENRLATLQKYGKVLQFFFSGLTKLFSEVVSHKIIFVQRSLNSIADGVNSN